MVLDFYVDQNRWYDPNALYDPRYRSYYEQAYAWYNYDPEAYRRHDPYFGQQYSNRYIPMLTFFLLPESWYMRMFNLGQKIWILVYYKIALKHIQTNLRLYTSPQ